MLRTFHPGAFRSGKWTCCLKTNKSGETFKINDKNKQTNKQTKKKKKKKTNEKDNKHKLTNKTITKK